MSVSLDIRAQIRGLRVARTVEDAARVLHILATVLPGALEGIVRALAEARAASTPEAGLEGLHRALGEITSCRGKTCDCTACALVFLAQSALRASPGLHGDCSYREPCAIGRAEHCPREPARELRRAARRQEWSALEVRHEDGLRHYLDGRAVHCGEVIELQAIEERRDPDGNAYAYPLPHGVVVGYEASQDGRMIRVGLDADVGGRSFVAGLDDGMRFRWPKRAGDAR
jgi:hypothetical protein